MRHVSLVLIAGLLATPPMVIPSPSLAQNAAMATQPEQAAALFAQAEDLHTGQGVLQNFQAAAALYAQAAELDHAGAQNRLGQYYHAGLGVPKDHSKALHWLRAAATAGDPAHVFDLAQALESDGPQADPVEAARLYQQAADAGHQEAAVNLAVLYQDGTGVPQDLDRAFALYQNPAQAGHARAQNNLGLLYVRGNGVAQDYPRAVALFQAAADQGLPTAMTNLSVMYANGFGVPQSDEVADQWARLASQTRQDAATVSSVGSASDTEGALCQFDPRLAPPPQDPRAQDALTRSATAGDPVAQFLIGWQLCSQPETSLAALRDASRWFEAAAARGHGPAMVNMGQFYLHGVSVPQDYVLAYMWLLLANSAGQTQVLTQSAALQQLMTPAQLTDAQERAAQRWQGPTHP